MHCKYNDLMIELTGVGGKNGRMGILEAKVKRLEDVQLKLMLYTFSSAMAGGGAIAGLLKVLG